MICSLRFLDVMMTKFWLFLWLRWAIYVSVVSIIVGSVLASFVTLLLFFVKSHFLINTTTLVALYDIFLFLMPIFWSLSFVITLLWSLKKIFHICIYGFALELYDCDGKTQFETIAVKNLRKLWRKWLFALIWTSAALTVISVLLVYIFSLTPTLFGWFSIYWLYSFVLLSGLITLPMMAARCKMVKVISC